MSTERGGTVRERRDGGGNVARAMASCTMISESAFSQKRPISPRNVRSIRLRFPRRDLAKQVARERVVDLLEQQAPHLRASVRCATPATRQSVARSRSVRAA